eukprot:c9666_g1_i1.p1 GENE.c9666_g1_i1~~c9666_g1_i1.p1  ORF type:complete len:296 (+),score=49.72 c9666_g1_i1:204-1091(+)
MADPDAKLTGRMARIKHKILVLSGKGGVGKSTTAVRLAVELVRRGHTVGVLDVDLCGPSIPKMLGVDEKIVHQSSDGWVPVFVNESRTLSVMSLAFLLGSKSDAVIWRGPRKNAMIAQFLRDVVWGALDYLVVDTPPGTSDEHISVVQMLQAYSPDGAVIVSTPQNVALADVRRQVTFCERVGLPLLGVVENMSGFVCPCCQEVTHIFGNGGAEALATMKSARFLGRVPLDPRMSGEVGPEGVLAAAETAAAEASPVHVAFVAVVDAILEGVAAGVAQRDDAPTEAPEASAMDLS